MAGIEANEAVKRPSSQQPPAAACGEGRFRVGIFRFWTSASPHGRATEKAGREVRLVLVRVTIRLLLQVEFLSGPRTENSADLAAIDRAFV
jgi:hypothetical protein